MRVRNLGVHLRSSSYYKKKKMSCCWIYRRCTPNGLKPHSRALSSLQLWAQKKEKNHKGLTCCWRESSKNAGRDRRFLTKRPTDSFFFFHEELTLRALRTFMKEKKSWSWGRSLAHTRRNSFLLKRTTVSLSTGNRRKEANSPVVVLLTIEKRVCCVW